MTQYLLFGSGWCFCVLFSVRFFFVLLFSIFICLQPLQRTVIDSIRFIKKEKVWSIPIIEIDFSSNHIFLPFFRLLVTWILIAHHFFDIKRQNPVKIDVDSSFELIFEFYTFSCSCCVAATNVLKKRSKSRDCLQKMLFLDKKGKKQK